MKETKSPKMKNTSRLLLIPAIFFGLLMVGVHLSNPDSEIAQDSSNAHDKTVPKLDRSKSVDESVQIFGSSKAGNNYVQKSAAMWSADRREIRIIDNSGIRGSRRVRVFRPTLTADGYLWREIGIDEALNRMRDRSILYRLLGQENNGSSTPMSNDGNNRGPNTGNDYRTPRPLNSNGPGARRRGTERFPNVPPNSDGTSYRGGQPQYWDAMQPDSFGDRIGNPNNRSFNRDSSRNGDSGTNYPGGVPIAQGNRNRDSGTNYPGGVPIAQGTRNRDSGANYPGGVLIPQGTRNGDSGANYPGGVLIPQGTRNGDSGTNYPGGVPIPQGTRNGDSGTNYPRGVPIPQGTRNGDSGTNYPGGVPIPQGTRNGGSLNTGTSTPSKRVSPDSNLFAGIVNDFAFKLVEALNTESNFVISPLSLFIALSMCYLGTEGQTRAQMEQALGMNENNVHGEHLHQGIRDLVSLLQSIGNLEMSVANGMFLGQNFTPEVKFVEDIQKYYVAELKNLDFGKPDLTVSVINDWVSKSTRNAITNLLDTPPPPQVRLLLLNAIYFKGMWKRQFPTELTYSGRFEALDGRIKEVLTMTLYRETFPLYHSDDHKHSFIKLPYADDQVSMIIALPYKPTDKPMPSVRDQTLCHILDAMKDTQLDRVAVPRFRLESLNSFREPLIKLGIRDIFDPRSVDFRRLRRQNDVYVNGVFQKVLVEVNEEGTTAAAVTGVRFVPLSIRNTTDFVVDHPFAFYIVHEPSGLVLFYGKIYDLGVPVPERRMNVRPRANSALDGNGDDYDDTTSVSPS